MSQDLETRNLRIKEWRTRFIRVSVGIEKLDRRDFLPRLTDFEALARATFTGVCDDAYYTPDKPVTMTPAGEYLVKKFLGDDKLLYLWEWVTAHFIQSNNNSWVGVEQAFPTMHRDVASNYSTISLSGYNAIDDIRHGETSSKYDKTSDLFARSMEELADSMINAEMEKMDHQLRQHSLAPTALSQASTTPTSPTTVHGRSTASSSERQSTEESSSRSMKSEDEGESDEDEASSENAFKKRRRGETGHLDQLQSGPVYGGGKRARLMSEHETGSDNGSTQEDLARPESIVMAERHTLPSSAPADPVPRPVSDFTLDLEEVNHILERRLQRVQESLDLSNSEIQWLRSWMIVYRASLHELQHYDLIKRVARDLCKDAAFREHFKRVYPEENIEESG